MALLIIALVLTAGFYPNVFKDNRIKSYSIGVENPQVKYELKQDENESESGDLFYEPNLNAFTSVAINSEHFSLGVAVESSNSSEKEDEFEKTNVFDLQLLGVFDRYLWEVFYQNHQGLYILEDSLDDDPSLEPGDFPAANSFNYGIGVKYFTKKDFNLRNSLSYFSLKKQSNWSWLHGLQLSHSKLYSSQDSLIPGTFQDEFSSIDNLKAIELRSLSYEFGFAGMLTSDYIYLSGLFSVGPAFQYQHLEGIDVEDRYISGGKSTIFVDLGAKFGQYAFGVQVRGSIIGIPVQDTQFTQTRGLTALYFAQYF